MAGWSMATDDAEFRSNAAGDELAPKFTTSDAAFRQTWAAVEAQMAAAASISCACMSSRLVVGDTTGINRRDFEVGAWGWTGQPDPGGQTLYACDQTPFPENGWEGQNSMGWCNETADRAIKAANNTLEREGRIEQYRAAQQEFTKDMVSVPLFNRTDTYATAAGR
jgi:ABC-type transport system substrate-binding protein